LNNSAEPLRVLIDTTFLLPTLGIDVGKQTNRALKKLAEIDAEIYYSRFSILESLWIAARNVGNSAFDIDRYSHGLRSVMESGRYEKLDESSEVFGTAVRLYQLGHMDMIDNILYASSVQFGLRFLTVDNKLRDFIEEKHLERTLLLVDNLG
jgi:PIN domain nuclease of toxin-antitoxin system